MHFSIDRTVHTTAFDKPVVVLLLVITLLYIKGYNVFMCVCFIKLKCSVVITISVITLLSIKRM